MKSLNLIVDNDHETIVECSHCWLQFVLESVIENWAKINSIVLFSVDCPHCKKELFAFKFDDSW